MVPRGDHADLTADLRLRAATRAFTCCPLPPATSSASPARCLPTELAEQPSAALDTAMRADTVRALATEAGCARVDVRPVDDDFFRLYRI
jgi:hypothetical protein